MEVNMNYCPECGTKRLEQAKYCHHCGFKFIQLSQASTKKIAVLDINEFGYARESLLSQDIDAQVEALLGVGIPIEKLYVDKNKGKKIEDCALENLVSVVRAGDKVVIKKLDGLGRSLSQVTGILEQFIDKGVYIKSIDDDLDTSDGVITNEIMSRVLAIFALMEKNFLIEKTKPAILAAKEAGVKFGAPRKYEKEYEEAIKLYLENSYTVSQVLEKYPVIKEPTFFRRLREYKLKNGIK